MKFVVFSGFLGLNRIVFLFFLGILQQMDANVTVNCVHPGIVRTRLTRETEGIVTGWIHSQTDSHPNLVEFSLQNLKLYLSIHRSDLLLDFKVPEDNSSGNPRFYLLLFLKKISPYFPEISGQPNRKQRTKEQKKV